MPPPRGLFIVLEGGEGAGKSTLARALVRRLEESGRRALLTREPGGTPIGEVLRQMTRKPALTRRFYNELHGESTWTRVSPTAELLLFAADRAQHIDSLVAPALTEGTSVVCDRFTASTLAYQGAGRGLPLPDVTAAIALATRGTAPDLTLLLDVPVEVGLARKADEQGRDQIGQETRAFHERVRARYLELARDGGDRWLALDATLPPAHLERRAWERVREVSESLTG